MSKSKQSLRRRRVRNYLINPKLQLKFSTMSTFLLIAVHSAITAVFMIFFNFLTSFNFELPYVFPAVLAALVLSYVSLLVMAFVLSIIASHRIIGPLEKIRQHLEKVAQGDFSGEVRLRKRDELQDIALRMNELTEKLRQNSQLKEMLK